MSRLDDLKNKKELLEMELDGLDATAERLEYHDTHETGMTYEELEEAFARLRADNERLTSRLREVEKEIMEEEKKLPAQKASSFRPQQYQEEERVCRRCGSPLGHETICYRCLTLNG